MAIKVNPAGVASYYQRNISQPINLSDPNKWYAGDAPTFGETLGRIHQISQEDPERGKMLQNKLIGEMSNKSSRYYNPYAKATNKAVNYLAAYGFDLNNLNDDWFNANSGWISSNLLYNGTSNTPSQPGKKATWDQNVAYQLWQYHKSEADTKKAEEQWKALQEEVTYWTKRKDLNLNDDEILGKIDWKKYGMLEQMDANKYYNPTELNRAIGYSKDALKGVIWNARNGQEGGNLYQAMAYSALGAGVQYKDNEAIRAKRDNNSEDYNPYAVGMTLQDEGVYFGVSSFTPATIEKIRKNLDMNDATANKMFQNVLKAEQNTQKLENQLKSLRSEMASMYEYYYDDPDYMLDLLRDNKDYKDLFDLDASMNTWDLVPDKDLVPTTRSINYKWSDIEKEVRARCQMLKNAKTPTVKQPSKMEEYITGSAEPPVQEKPAEKPQPQPTPPSIDKSTHNDWYGRSKVRSEADRLLWEETDGVPDSVARKLTTGISDYTKDMFDQDEAARRAAYDKKFGAGAYDKAIAEESGTASESPETVPQDMTTKRRELKGPTDSAVRWEANMIAWAEQEKTTKDNIGSKPKVVNLPSVHKPGDPEVAPENLIYTSKDWEEDEAYRRKWYDSKYGEGAYDKAIAEEEAAEQAEAPATPQPRQAPDYNTYTEPVTQPAVTPEPTQAPVTQPAVTPAPTQAPAPATPAPTEAEMQEEIERKNTTALFPTIKKLGTEIEKFVFGSGVSNAFNDVVKFISELPVTYEQALGTAKKSTQKKAVDAAGAYDVKYDYEDTQEYLQAKQQELDDIDFQIRKAEGAIALNGGVTPEEESLTYSLVNSGALDTITGLLNGNEGDRVRGLNAFYSYTYGDGEIFLSEFSKYNNTEEYLADHPEVERIIDLATNGYEKTGNYETLTANEMQDLYDTKAMLEETITETQAELEEKQATYDEANKKLANVANDYAMYQKVFGEDKFSDALLHDIETFKEAGRSWSNYNFGSRTPWQDIMTIGEAAGYSKKELLEKSLPMAARTISDGMTELDSLKKMMEVYQGIGLEASDEELKNIQQKITVLEQSVEEASWFLMQNDPEFYKIAAQGKKIDTEGLSEITQLNVKALLNENDKTFYSDMGNTYSRDKFLRQFTENRAPDDSTINSAQRMIKSMGEDEKDLYFYLLETAGEKEANAYLAKLVNPVNGRLAHRDVADEAQKSREFAARDFGSAALNWVMAFGTNVVGGITSVGKNIEYGLRGEENADPEGIGFRTSVESEAMRAGVSDWIKKQPWGKNGELVDFLMNAINSAGDSTINAILTSGALSILGEAVPMIGSIQGFLQTAQGGQYGKILQFGSKAFEDWAHAVPMALMAADRASREAKANNATPEQMRAIAMSTFWAESISEAITVGNIKDMWERGGDVKGLLRELFSNGLEEAVGEGFNEWWESNADRAIMQGLSEYQKTVDKYVAAGIPRTRAEAIAEQEQLKQIAVAAASGFVSSAISGTIAYVKGDVQEGRNDAKLNQMREGDMAKLEATDADGNQNTATTLTSILSNNSLINGLGRAYTTAQETMARAASRLFISKSNNGDSANANRVARGLLSMAEGNLLGIKDAITYGSLTNANTNRVLTEICENVFNGGKVTEEDVNNLLTAMQEDKTGEGAMQNNQDMNDAVRGVQKAENIAKTFSTGEAKDRIKAAEKAENDAKTGLKAEEEAKKVADARVESAEGKRQAAFEEQMNNPTPENHSVVQQATEELTGAVNAQEEAQTRVEQSQKKVDEAAQATQDTQEKIMTEAREQAEVATQQEEQAQADLAQQEFEDAINMYHPVKAFAKPATVQLNNGAGSVQITGIYAVKPDGTYIYSTTQGYVTDAELNGDTWSDTSELDKALDSLPANPTSINPVQPAYWFDHSLKGVSSFTGEIIDIVGIMGEDESTTYFVDSNGTVYSLNDFTMDSDWFNGSNADQAEEELWANIDAAGELPEYTVPSEESDNTIEDETVAEPQDENYEISEEEANQILTGETQMPEGYIEYEGTPTEVEAEYEFIPGQKATIPTKLVGVTFENGTMQYVTEAGIAIDPSQVKSVIDASGGFWQWALTQYEGEQPTQDNAGQTPPTQDNVSQTSPTQNNTNQSSPKYVGTQFNANANGDYYMKVPAGENLTYTIGGTDHNVVGLTVTQDGELGFELDNGNIIAPYMLSEGSEGDSMSGKFKNWAKEHADLTQWMLDYALPEMTADLQTNDPYLKNQFAEGEAQSWAQMINDALQEQQATQDNVNQTTPTQDNVNQPIYNTEGLANYLEVPSSIPTVEYQGHTIVGLRIGASGTLRMLWLDEDGDPHSVQIKNAPENWLSSHPEFAEWMVNTVVPELESGNFQTQTSAFASLIDGELQYLKDTFGKVVEQNNASPEYGEYTSLFGYPSKYIKIPDDIAVQDVEFEGGNAKIVGVKHGNMSGSIRLLVQKDNGKVKTLTIYKDYGSPVTLNDFVNNNPQFAEWLKSKVIPEFGTDNYEQQVESAPNDEYINSLKYVLGMQDSQNNVDEYSEGKTDKDGNPIKNWQDPKYHGKVKQTTKKTNPKTKKFKDWFKAEMIPDAAKPYLLNPDGSPRVVFHGFGAYGHTLYNVHQSKPKVTSSGKTVSYNFYFHKKGMASKYAGTTKILHLRHITNWETAKVAMQDIGYDLVEKQNPATGEMGYQVINGVGSEVSHGKLGKTWFKENELKRFRQQYGGGLASKGIHAGYISSQNPLVITGLHCNYSNVTADVTAPDGSNMSGTHRTRRWAEWAFEHGYDAVIFDEVQDAPGGSGGEYGVEIITSQPTQFKGVYNSGNYSQTDGDYMALKVSNKTGKSKPLAKMLKALESGKSVDQMTPEERQALRKNIENLPEVQRIMAEQTQQEPTISYKKTDAVKKFDGSEKSINALREAGVPEETITLLQNGADYYEAVESMFTPEDVEEQHRVRDKMAYEQGSAVFDENGKVQYTGKVNQGKRVDIVVGLPASGKSTLAEALSAMFGSRMLDSDDAKKFHKNYAGGANSGPLHNESRFITDQAMNIMIDNGDNVILPVVGHSFKSVARQIKAFKDEGYEVHLHDVQLPWGKAIARTLNRMVEDNRLLDMGYITGTDSTGLSPQKINETFDRLTEEGYVDGYAVWNNDVKRGEPPIALGYSSPEEVNITTGAFGKKAAGSGNGDSGRGANVLSGGMAQTQGENGIQALKVDNAPQTPTKKQAQKVKNKLKSPQQIAKTLIKSLGFGDYLGSNNFGMLKGARGYWEKHAELVAVKDRDIGNYSVTMHEAGHGIAQKLGMTGTQQMVDNLIQENPAFADAYSADVLQDEAFAEFMWRYMEDDQRARDFAGDDFVDDFERRLAREPGMAKAVSDARSMLQQWINASTDEKVESLVRYENSQTKVPFAKQVRDLINRLADSTSIADEVDAYVGQQSGERGKLRLQGLFANHSQRRAVTNLTDSLTNARGTIIGDGFGKRLSDIGFQGTEENIHLLERYALLLHSLARNEQRKPVFGENISDEEIQRQIEEIENTRPDIVKAEQAWQEFRHDFLQAWMVDTGYWSQEFFDHLEEMYPHYVPTFRVRGDMDGATNPTGFGKSAKKYTLKRATGGSEDIYSPMYSFIGMVNQITSMVGTNQVAQLFDQYYQENEGMGIFGRMIPGGEDTAMTPTGGLNARQQQLNELLEGSISAEMMEKVLEITKSQPGVRQVDGKGMLDVHREDGTVVRYEIDNPELYKMLSGVQGSTGIRAMNVIGKFTRVMSMLTTGSNPLFAARNAVRDFQNSVNYGSWASNYGTGLLKWASTFLDVIRDSDVYKEYKAMGGGGWTRIEQGNAKSMQEVSNEIFGTDQLKNANSLGKTAKWFGKTVTKIVTFEALNEAIEQTSRLAEYKYGQHDRQSEEGRLEAFQAAQDVTVDFSRSGNSETAYVMKKLIPFFNASMQGAYRTARMGTEAERGRLAQRLTKTIVNQAIMSAIAAGLILRGGDDEDKEEFMMLSDGIKANHLVLPNFAPNVFGDAPYLRIPLAQDPLTYAVHSAVTNSLINGADDDLAIGLAATVDVILDNLNPIGGTIFQPFIDKSHNKTWYGSNIVRSNQVDWTDKSVQYNEDTPEVFKWAGRLIGESPEVIEYLATQYTGFLGALAIPALSYEKDGSLGGVDAMLNAAQKKWTTDPLSSNDYTKEFYDKKAALDTIVDVAKKDRPENLLRRSLSQAEVDAAYEEAVALTSKGGIVYEARNAINDAYKAIDSINANTTLSDEDKSELTRKERLKMLKQVEAANEAMQGYYKKYVQGETLIDRVFGAIREGKYAHIKTDAEKMGDTFQNDMDKEYMQKSMSVYEKVGKSSALPHPGYTFTLDTVRSGRQEFTITEDERDEYDRKYKEVYEAYLNGDYSNLKWSKAANDWGKLSDEDKLKALQAAAEYANRKMREYYAEQHKIQLKKNGSGSLSTNNIVGSLNYTNPSKSIRDDMFWEGMYRNTNGVLKGLGNIDLNKRQVVENPDGTFSTELSFSFYDEDTGKEVLIPSVVNGQILSEDEAIDYYYKSGEYLGMFDTPEEAEEYAERLHDRQDWYYSQSGMALRPTK